MIAASATALLVIAIALAAFFYQNGTGYLKDLNTEKLRNEGLLSEKLALNKEMDKFKKEIASLQGRNRETDLLLNEARQKLAEKEKQINRLNKENASIQGLRAQLADLQKMRDEMVLQIDALNDQNTLLAEENSDLKRSLQAANDNNSKLQSQVNLLMATAADNYRVETYKGKKEKLTVHAARARQLSLSFEIPQSLAEDISFRLVTPSGKTITSDNGDLAYTFVEENRSFLASLSPMSGEFEVSKRVEMVYKPQGKMKPGIYKVEILNKDSYIGSCQVRLR